MNFDILSNGDVFNRTNDINEAFHHKLSNAIGCSHPRVSIFLEKLIDLSIDYYQIYVSKLFKENSNKKITQNVFNDIFHFLEKFLNKYNKNINIKTIITR